LLLFTLLMLAVSFDLRIISLMYIFFKLFFGKERNNINTHSLALMVDAVEACVH